jgi:hypothetical protein
LGYIDSAASGAEKAESDPVSRKPMYSFAVLPPREFVDKFVAQMASRRLWLVSNLNSREHF